MTGKSGHALAELPPTEWRVIDDFSFPGGHESNIDHVVIGPQGVFVIKTLVWTGDIDVSGGELWQNGERVTDLVEGATSAAAAVGNWLPVELQGTVMPVLCLLRSEPVVGWAGAAMVCSTENLLRMLNARPRLLDELAIDQAQQLLGAAQPESQPQLQPQPQPQPQPLTESEPVTDAEMQSGTQPEPEAEIQPEPEAEIQPEPEAEIQPGSLCGAAGPPLTRQPTAREWSLRRCSERWVGSAHVHRGLRRWLTLVILVVLVMLVAGVLRPEVFGTLGGAVAKSIEDLRHPSQSFGQHVNVQGSAARPPLEFVAERPVRTWSRTSRVRAGRGHQLVAVAMTVRNAGNQMWISYPSSTVLMLRDETNVSYGVNPTVRKTEAGKVMPAVIRVRPGRSVRGFIVFEVPRGTRIAAVELTVGPGDPQRVRWATA